MSFRYRAPWIAIALGAVLVGACGGDRKASQAEIDASVAKAMASTTSTAAPPGPTTTSIAAPTTAMTARPASTTTVVTWSLDPKCESWDSSNAGSPICTKWNYSPGYSNPQVCSWQPDGTCKVMGKTATTGRACPRPDNDGPSSSATAHDRHRPEGEDLGKGRRPQGWVVSDQTPAAGTMVAEDQLIDLGAKKFTDQRSSRPEEESRCPTNRC